MAQMTVPAFTRSITPFGGDVRSADPNGVGAQVELKWDRATTYTDASILFPKSFIIRYGTTTSGPYPTAVDMSTDTDPAMLRKTIPGLDPGTTYYFVIQTVDSEGFVSAQTGEVAIAATLATVEVDPTVYTEVRQVDLPLTINSSGAYRIMENLSYDTAGSGIICTADDITIFAAVADSIVYTVSTTTDVSGIEPQGARSNIKVHGFHITTGGFLSTGSTSNGHIYTSNAGNGIAGFICRHMTFTMGVANANMLGNSNFSGGIVFRSPTGIGITGEIHDCIFNLKGTKAGSGIRGITKEAGGSAANLIGYNNTFNCDDVSGVAKGYQRLITGLEETYGNVIDINNCQFDLVGGFGIVGINEVPYPHNNTFTVTLSSAVRGIMMENDSTGRVNLYNHMVIVSTAGYGDVRLYRNRFGSNDNIMGYSTCTGNLASLALCLVDMYGTQVPYGLTRNNYVYHNTASGMQNGLLNVREQLEDTYFWSNTADSTNIYGAYLRSIGLGDDANGCYWDGDDINGSTADVRLQTDGAFPACEATHFAGLGAISISNNDPTETTQETDFWLDGDAGLITHTKKNTGSRTPTAPTNLRAA